jgi:hypothetical protein
MTELELAVNGTLMRGLDLNPNLVAVGASFLRETETAPSYRLWSIQDRYPAMLRVNTGGRAIAVELWSVSPTGLVTLLRGEPAGLAIGKVQLADQTEVFGVLGEPFLCEGCREISSFGGWRHYIANLATARNAEKLAPQKTTALLSAEQSEARKSPMPPRDQFSRES